MGFVTALLVAMSGAAQAQESEILFSHKEWQIEILTWDDGAVGCVALVSAPGESFSIWTFPDGKVQLQFYSMTWQFGEGETADLEVQIDGGAPWSLTNAELLHNHVLFYLPDNAAGVTFNAEVARGKRLYLRSTDGGEIQEFSLAGARPSMNALKECDDVIGRAKPVN